MRSTGYGNPQASLISTCRQRGGSGSSGNGDGGGGGSDIIVWLMRAGCEKRPMVYKDVLCARCGCAQNSHVVVWKHSWPDYGECHTVGCTCVEFKYPPRAEEKVSLIEGLQRLRAMFEGASEALRIMEEHRL